MAKTQPLILSDDDREYFESIVRTRTMQAQIVSRARILLLKADGDSVDTIAEKVGLNRNSDDFIEFLKILDKKYPKGDVIRLVLDNHSVHTSRKTKAFLETMQGRFLFVFTPKHGSWLNMIDGFFGKMTRQMLHGIMVSTKQELVDRIYLYFEEINQTPVVHHWKYKMDEVDASECIDKTV